MFLPGHNSTHASGTTFRAYSSTLEKNGQVIPGDDITRKKNDIIIHARRILKLMEKKTIANNRKAFHNYAILEKIEAGIMLTGYEVKSLRKSSANLTDGFVNFKKNEAFLENVHIPPYAQQSTHILDFNSRRSRKVLMHRDEIRKLHDKTREKGLTLVPLEIYFSPKGMAKVMLGLGKGKNTVDKRETLKKRDVEREMRRDR